jgi:hypothetical protein
VITDQGAPSRLLGFHDLGGRKWRNRTRCHLKFSRLLESKNVIGDGIIIGLLEGRSAQRDWPVSLQAKRWSSVGRLTPD